MGNRAEIRFYNHLMREYVASEWELESNGYPRENPYIPGSAIIQEVRYGDDEKTTSQPGANQRKCARCQTIFPVDATGKCRSKEICRFHSRRGKLVKKGKKRKPRMRHACCDGSAPCMTYKTHVAFADDVTGYVHTDYRNDRRANKSVYALDTEMIWTTKSLEIAQVTVVDMNLQPVYECYIKPDAEIIDYNTTYSGIQATDLLGVRTTLADVQADLLELFTDQTILMGHGLENDLKALKLIHGTVVDTSLVFPHRKGPPFKRGLAKLSEQELKTSIPKGIEHGSHADAVAAMRLMLKKTGRQY